MAWYDQGYDASRRAALPQFGKAITSGLQTGQKLRQGVLAEQAAKQQAQQQGQQRAALGDYLGGEEGQMATLGVPMQDITAASQFGSPLAQFKGSSLDIHALNEQTRYNIENLGMNQPDARRKAINDIRTTKQTSFIDPYTGTVQTRTGLALPDATSLREAKNEEDYMRAGIDYLAATPPDQKQEAWDKFASGIVDNKYEKREDVPTEYSPEYEDKMKEGLYGRAQEATGIASGVKAFAGWLQGHLVGQISPTNESARSARQDLRMSENKLIKSLAVNKRFPVAELKRVKDMLDINPTLMQSPPDLQLKIRNVDEDLRASIAQARSDSGDMTLPMEIRRRQASNAIAMQDFVEALGVPQDEAVPTGGNIGINTEGTLSPAEEAELQELERMFSQ